MKSEIKENKYIYSSHPILMKGYGGVVAIFSDSNRGMVVKSDQYNIYSIGYLFAGWDIDSFVPLEVGSQIILEN